MKIFSKRCVKIAKTSALYLSFFGLGLSAAIPGPTLLDLQHIVNTETSKIAFIYLARSFAALVGSLLGGVLFDLMRKKQLLLFVCNMILTITTLATPWSRSVTTLVSLWAIVGLGLGALVTGSNVLCLNLWGKESAPYFQGMHFLFGVGAFFAPLIAEPFLLKPSVQNLADNGTSLNVSASFTDNETGDTASSDNMTDSSCNSYVIPPVTYAYTIIGVFNASVTMFFLFLSILFPTEEKPEKQKPNEEEEVKTPKDSLMYTVVIVFVGQILLCLYCGIEIGYGQMLAIFCVKGDLKLSKSTASFITAFFWGVFTFSRGFSVYLSSRFSAFSLVLSDLIAVVIGSGILLAYGSSHVEVLWAGTFILAIGLASFFPSVITWVEGYLHLNNKIVSLFVVSATFGEMIVPLTVSQYIESQPQMLMYIIVGCSLGGSLVTFLLWLIMRKKGKKQ